MSPLRKVQYFVFNCSYPLPLKGGTIEYQYLKMSPLGDLENHAAKRGPLSNALARVDTLAGCPRSEDPGI